MTRAPSGFSDALLERFRDTRRVGRLDAANARGEAVGAVCGDRVELTLYVEAGKVRDARFLAQGCAVAIASAAAVAGAVVGRRAVVGTVGGEELDAWLGGIPKGRAACAQAALAALDAALSAPRGSGPG